MNSPITHSRIAFAALLAVSLGTLPAQEAEVPGELAAMQALYRCAVMVDLEEDEKSLGQSIKERNEWEYLGCGSGVILDGGRLLVTNLHVAGRKGTREAIREMTAAVPSAKRISWSFTAHPAARGDWSEAAFNQPRNTYPRLQVSQHMLQSQLADVMAFPIRDSGFRGIQRFVRSEHLKPGDRLYTLGNPNCESWRWSVGTVTATWKRGTGSSLNPMVDDLHQWLVRNPEIPDVRSQHFNSLIFASSFIQGGNSGGPVVDEHGRLAGICFATFGGHGVIIPMEEIYRALRREAPSTSPPLGIAQSSSAAIPEPTLPPPSEQEFTEVQEKLDSGEFVFSLGKAPEDHDTTTTLRR